MRRPGLASAAVVSASRYSASHTQSFTADAGPPLKGERAQESCLVANDTGRGGCDGVETRDSCCRNRRLTPFAQRLPCISQGIALGEALKASHDMVGGRSECIPDRLHGGQLLITAALHCARTAPKPNSALSSRE